MLLQIKVKLMPNNGEKHNNALTLGVCFVPGIAEMEDKVTLNVEPGDLVCVFGIFFEYSISCWKVLVEMEKDPFVLDGTWGIHNQWKVWNNSVPLCDHEVMNHPL